MSIAEYNECTLCPRACHAHRNAGESGVCGADNNLRIARAALHFWEEPPISGIGSEKTKDNPGQAKNPEGSGAIFFSGCPLRCIFCQNHEISADNFGRAISTARLAKIMLELQDKGALNINLVTPLHFAPQIAAALSMAKKAGLTLPIVCNTSGYESLRTVKAMHDYIDIWLTDFKYASSALAQRFSYAKDYPRVATDALKEMIDQIKAKGGRISDEKGHMRQGIIVRHLVLPQHSDDSCAILDLLWELGKNDIDISIMNQYTPNRYCREQKNELSQPLGQKEYEKVLRYADDLGFERMWWQQGGTVSESFVPAFDASGVEGEELR